MIRKILMIGAVLALAMIASAHPVKAQCTPLTLTVNGSGSATVPRNGATLASYTKSFQLQPGQTQPESQSLKVPNAPGTYVGTATSSNGGSVTATVTVI